MPSACFYVGVCIVVLAYTAYMLCNMDLVLIAGSHSAIRVLLLIRHFFVCSLEVVYQ